MASRHAPMQPGGLSGRATLWLRRALGVAQLHQQLGLVREQLNRMERQMATEAEQLQVIKDKLLDVHADVRAKLDQVRAETSPEGQAKLDEISAAIESFDQEIGDADGSDTPPPVDEGEPPAPEPADQP